MSRHCGGPTAVRLGPVPVGSAAAATREFPARSPPRIGRHRCCRRPPAPRRGPRPADPRPYYRPVANRRLGQRRNGAPPSATETRDQASSRPDAGAIAGRVDARIARRLGRVQHRHDAAHAPRRRPSGSRQHRAVRRPAHGPRPAARRRRQCVISGPPRMGGRPRRRAERQRLDPVRAFGPARRMAEQTLRASRLQLSHQGGRSERRSAGIDDGGDHDPSCLQRKRRLQCLHRCRAPRRAVARKRIVKRGKAQRGADAHHALLLPPCGRRGPCRGGQPPPRSARRRPSRTAHHPSARPPAPAASRHPRLERRDPNTQCRGAHPHRRRRPPRAPASPRPRLPAWHCDCAPRLSCRRRNAAAGSRPSSSALMGFSSTRMTDRPLRCRLQCRGETSCARRR